MVYKCQCCLVISGDEDHEVITEERVATTPLVGLELCLRRLVEKASLLEMPLKRSSFEMQLLGWVDPVVGFQDSESTLQAQKLRDGSERMASSVQGIIQEQF